MAASKGRKPSTGSAAFRKPVPVKELRWRCPPGAFGVRDSRDAAPLLVTVGQDDALAALRLGLELYGPGYHVYVAGLPGLGKTSLVQGLLEEMTPACSPPPDRVYVNHFRHPERPRLLEVPRGDGPRLVEDVQRLVEALADGIQRLSEDVAFAKRREDVVEQARREERTRVDAFEARCAEVGFSLGSQGGGPVVEPEVFVVVQDALVAIEDVDAAVRAGKIPADQEARVRETYDALRRELADLRRHLHEIARRRRRAVEDLESEAARRLAADAFAEVRKKAQGDAAKEHWAQAEAAFVAGFSGFVRRLLEASEGVAGRGEAVREVAGEVFREFRANLLLDVAAGPTCPVVVEKHPSWTNLFGQVERAVDAGGNPRVDFLLIRGGSLLRADGGYLVLQVHDLVKDAAVWEELKGVLKHSRLEITVPESQMANAPTALHPEPIPVNVKVILIGDEPTYYDLREADPEFAEIFKVKATFERDMPITTDALHRYASFFRKLELEDGLLPLDRGALAFVAEEGVREAGRKGRLSVRFGRIADLVREAHYVAKRRRATHVTADDVRGALEAAARRRGVEERRARRAVREGLILVEVDGARVGQVNGLSVYDFGDHRFGSFARITAAVGAGEAGVVNVERLAALSGPTHDKGVLILSGYLRETFAALAPASFTASVVFEQSYGGVTGDSATCAEVFAILSSLSGIPVRQDLAVTGSMNQHGVVQPVGGVNDKIEGFYDLCAWHGLTGRQGVVIPRANVGDLMLREDVVEACRRGRFAVYAIERVEEGMELLSGRASGVHLDGAGRAKAGAAFAPGSVYEAVAKRIAAMNEVRRPPEGLTAPARAREAPPPRRRGRPAS
jgi:lon-related putative ATP-dependent protease